MAAAKSPPATPLLPGLVLRDVHGNGSSSGTALDATLRNTTSAPLRLSTRLLPPLYLLSGTESARNMLATRVYESGGRFRMVDGESVIDLPPGETIPIAFNAYCVDFEKDNPSAEDSFTLAEMPSWLAPLASGVVSGGEPGHWESVARSRSGCRLGEVGHPRSEPDALQSSHLPCTLTKNTP